MRLTKSALIMLGIAADAVVGGRGRHYNPMLGIFGPALGFYGETVAGGGGADTLAGGGGGGGAGTPEMVPKDEANRAFKARDAFKAQVRGLVRLAGWSEDEAKHVKVVATEDADNPFRLELDGEDITAEFKARAKRKKARAGAAGAAGGTADDDDDDPASVDRRIQQRVASVREAATVRENALLKIVEELAVITPLRQAFAAEGAVDSGGEPGEYADQVALARQSLRVEVQRDSDGLIAVDETTARAKYTVTPLNPDATPMLNNGQPVGVRDFVKKFLEKRPAMKASGRPGGPGAGGVGGGPGGRTAPAQGSLLAGARSAGSGMFGLPAPGANGNS